MTTATTSEFFTALRSCAEVDRFFRLREGACRRAVLDGALRASKRQQRGRVCYYVDPFTAAGIWGPK